MSKKHVLMAVDDSECADNAVEFYMKNLYQDGESVTLFFVIQFPHLASFSVGTPIMIPAGQWEDIMTEHNKRAEAIEKKYTQLLRGNKMTGKAKYISANVASDSASHVGQEICNYAQKHAVDLVVVGSRGLNKLRRTFLGSTSEYVLHHLGAPVLVVPKPEKAAK